MLTKIDKSILAKYYDRRTRAEEEEKEAIADGERA